jgi:uncharacterized protein YndB with AHSA1/START domain
MKKKTVTVTTPSDREIAVTREFDAPRQLVWDAHTKPELLKRWGAGPPGWEMPECEMDFRVGGAWRWVLRGPGGAEMRLGGVHTEIVVGERVVRTETFQPAWYSGEAITTMALTERGGKTTLTVTIEHVSKEARDAALKFPMAEGMAAGYDKLDELLLHSVGA